ncbi:hypothetical protein FHX37_0271 [Haloactinospora alba]|uniref:Uncharacterized protein n=1 Tax=Haloactinospora alba TaxID=405555 RepID=A0A543NEY1_9ACTN|nr:hypothetical protein [Haloactinospora alba]TQN30394.1 hypothetical protein FHX37_0271 [Haloactinospora alba]
MKRREQSQTEQLRQALSEREAQLHEAQARLAALEGSTSFQVGRTLTAAAKRPGRGLMTLPRDLFRLWRGSQGSRSSGNRSKPGPVRSYEAQRQEARLLTGTPGADDGRIVVAGILSPEARAALDPYVRVVPLRSHDTQVVFESVDVDALVITASASAPGSSWSHVGDPAAADRTRALHWTVEAARSRGVPSVLIADAPAPPALAALDVDLHYHGDVGVPLHRFNPVAAEPERDPEPVHVPTAGSPHPATRRLLASLEEHGTRPASPRWEELPATLRAVSAVATDTPGLARRATACGARALLLGRDDGDGDTSAAPRPPEALRTLRPGAGGPHSHPVGEELARLRAQGPLTSEELRSTLRHLFLTEATPVRLAELFRQVQLAPGAGNPDLPLHDRRVALLALPGDDITSLSLAEDILAQQYPPAEVVVPQESAPFTGVERLRSHGIPVRTAPVSVPSAAPGPDVWAALARAAESPWAALWREPQGPAFLVDALCAAECSGADAVGPAIDSWRQGDAPHADAVDQAAADQEYVFVSAIRPALARCELVRRGLQPGVWNRHGARLLALSPPHGTEPEESPDHARTAPKGNT